MLNVIGQDDLVFLKTRFVIDGKICMSQRKIMKTLIALEKKEKCISS